MISIFGLLINLINQWLVKAKTIIIPVVIYITIEILDSMRGIYGVVNIGWTTGASVGPLLTGYIFDLADSYEMAFLLAVATSLLGLLFTASIRPVAAVKKIN